MKPTTAAALSRVFEKLPAPVLEAMLFVVRSGKQLRNEIPAYLAGIVAAAEALIKIALALVATAAGCLLAAFIAAGLLGLLLIGIRAL